SHCCERRSRKRCASFRRSTSSSKTFSRPCHALRTRPASSRTRRCLVIACRVTRAPCVSPAIESRPRSPRRLTMRSRVSSPSAAKTRSGRNVFLDQLHLLGPPALVRREGLGAASRREAVEPALGQGELRSARHFLERELDQRHRLFRVVEVRLDRERVPAEGEDPLRLDAID